MATAEQLQAQLAARRARQPSWMTEKGDNLYVEKYDQEDGSKLVLFIRILANKVRGSDGTSTQSVPMAHFRILLVLNDSGEDPSSVELNSTRLISSTGVTRLLITSRKWTHSAGTSQVLVEKDVPFIPGHALPTVDTVLNILVENGRHRYKLHHSGSGCRYWTKVVLQDLIHAGYMAPESDVVVTDAMAEISEKDPEVLMIEDADGEFF